ncbi:MAG: strawberry notch C-terminal domain-containing protein [Pseudomonadota bacterium]
MSGSFIASETEAFLRVFYRGAKFSAARSKDGVIYGLTRYLEVAETTTQDAGLFGDAERVTPMSALQGVVNELAKRETQANAASADLFAQPQRSEGAGSGAAGGGEGGQRPVGGSGRGEAGDAGGDRQSQEEVTPQPQQKAAEGTTGAKSAFGAKNKVFTEEAAARARELLRKKLGQVNTGLDPEVVQAGIQLAGYYIEGGARAFTDYARKMLADLGEAARPYLKSWYMAVRYYPGFDAAGMQGAAELDAIDESAIAVESEEAPRQTSRSTQVPDSSEVSNIDAAAHEAATSPENDKPEPTEAQKRAGNYEKGHVRIAGLDISIENPAGSERSGIDANGKRWSVTMTAHYGYIRRTEGRDGDHVDVFVKPGTPEDYSGPVFVIDQKKPGNRRFDEHKVMLGWASREEAQAGYLENYQKGWDGIRATTEFSIDGFKTWLKEGDTTRPAAAPATTGEKIADELRGARRRAGGSSTLLAKETKNAAGSRTDTERDRPHPDAGDGLGAQAVRDEPAGAQRAGSGAVQEPGASGDRPGGGDRVSGDSAVAGGERGDQPLHRGDGQFGTAQLPARGDDDRRGADPGDRGVSARPDAAGAVERAARRAQSLDEKRAAQRRAEPIPVKLADRANIDDTLPFLNDGQREDVLFAERRFAKPDGYGVLFTNSTGTGKTYLGLGIVKRMVKQGRSNGLIVVPNDKMIEDWVKSGKNLGLDIHPLESLHDAGKGIAITTYANFGQNQTLADRDYDFVVADEAHNLMQNAQAEETRALATLRAIALHPDGIYQRARMVHRDLWGEIQRLDRLMRMPEEGGSASLEVINAKLHKLNAEFDEKRAAVKADVEARQGEARPRVTFLSATPFAYEKNVQWAEGFLFEYDRAEKSSAYNAPGPYERFMIQHFGYRMRNNRLTEPDAKVDRGLMQRQFNTWLRKQGVLSARILEVDFDYDRKFILIDSVVGAKIDEGMKWLREAAGGRFRALYDETAKRWDYLSRQRLLEAIKAEAAVPYIRAQHALGRKVVVFHDFNEGGGFNPFVYGERSDEAEVIVQVKKEGGGYETQSVKWNDLVREFKAQRPDLAGLTFDRLASPIATLTKAFPNALVFNGTVPKLKRRQAIAQFNDDANPGANLLIVQSAANAGWSGHDVTGKHQRVVLNLGLPTAPTKAIQQEGRVYRTGQASDAMFRYMNTGTHWERLAFASTIARRASTAENLAMGEQARGLLQSFIDAFENADAYPPSRDEGRGGKALDRAFVQAISDYDRAKTFYFGQQKKTSSTKAAEGQDYFATPEPVGLKLVEWLDVQPDDHLLEPSAGHGAIARWFPEQNQRTLVEPSMELASRLALVTDGKIVNDTFENLHTVNKFDGIAMNPPFGVEGKTAVEHLAKALRHLKDGGRIAAIIPAGPAADKRFEQWLYGNETRPVKPLAELAGKSLYKGDTITARGVEAVVTDYRDGLIYARLPGQHYAVGYSGREVKAVKATGPRSETVKSAPHAYLAADIKLPAVTFERAGTEVATRIVVIDKLTDKEAAKGVQTVRRDLTDIKDIRELFDRLENMEVPGRVKPQAAEVQAQAEGRIARSQDEARFEVRGGRLVTDAPKATYVTTAGKTLEGVYVPTKAMAMEVDKFAFRPKDAPGWFVRMKHVVRPEVSRVLESRARKPMRGDSKGSAILNLLAHSDDLFQQVTPEAKTVEAIAKEIDERYRVQPLSPSQAREKGAERGWDIIVPRSKFRSAQLYEKGGEVWIDVQRLLIGVDTGNVVYGIAMAYAHNTGKVFIGDPAGLSRTAFFRRTEAMLSSALKFGTTRHLEPHEAQVDPATYYNSNGEQWDYAFEARPITWIPGNDAHNLRELLYTSYKSAIDHVPELKNIVYDFERRAFVQIAPAAAQAAGGRAADLRRDAGAPGVAGARDAQLRGHDGAAGTATDSVGWPGRNGGAHGNQPRGGAGTGSGNATGTAGTPLPGSFFTELSRQVSTRPDSRYRAGSATLKRGALLNTLLRGQSEEGWRRTLAEVSRQLSGRLDIELREIFYSRAASSAEQFTDQAHVARLQGVVDAFTAEFKGAAALTIRVVNDRRQIPPKHRPSPYADGVYHDADGVVYLIAENIPTKARAVQILLHEAIGHYGLRTMMGERFAQLLSDVLKHARAASELDPEAPPLPSDRDYATVEAVRLLYPEAPDDVVAQEVLARLAETGADAPLLARVLAKLREWLRAVARALGADLAWSEADLRALVASAADFLRQGRNLEAAPGQAEGMAFASKAQEQTAARTSGFDKASGTVIADFKNDQAMKAHADYQAAKGGDIAAAVRLVQDLVQPASVKAAQTAFGEDVVYVPVHAEEAAGRNKLPIALAAHYAANASGAIGAGIFQVNRVYHTGANAMERLLARAEFDGPVEPGRRYVLVDDVTTMGSTLADLAGYIRSRGGEVAGSVVLVDANRSGMMVPQAKIIRELGLF